MKRITAAALGLAVAGGLLLAAPAQAAPTERAAGAVEAAPAAQATAPYPDEIRVVTWNICGEAGGSRGQVGYCAFRNEPDRKAEQVAQLVTEHQANVVMLQEVCGYDEATPEADRRANWRKSHMALLKSRLGDGWSLAHAPGNRESDLDSRCRGEALGGDLGVLLAVKGTFAGEIERVETVPADLSQRKLPLLCARVTGWADKICTTHLIPGEAPVAKRQSEIIAEHLKDDIPVGVVIGADFNRNAAAAELAPLADPMDRCVNGDHTYQYWAADAAAPNRHWLDHLFTTKRTSGARFVSCVVDQSRMDRTQNTGTEATNPPNGYSDHAPVIAYLRDAPVPGDMTGDGKPDLVAVDDEGKLRLYHGKGTGGIPGAHDIIGTGGWTGASVTHRGDWTGDGKEDVVARVGGDLRIYANRGDGSLAAPVKLVGGLPVDAKVVSAGDLTRDGHPDTLLSYDDRLWLYAGVRGAVPAVAAPVLVGNSGWDVMTLTAPGDADRDGRPDLLARHTSTGDLWLYRGRDGGRFEDRTLYGHGYGVTNRPLLAGAADADGNGVADLWTTTNEGTGTLMFYAGATGAAGDPVDGARTTVGLSGWNTIRSIS
ncbi:FG-GAP-like repeat-containing protein [Streptomyces sp. NPDC006551]|uniref:FG-GAP-like repeat-containing protein n=1 Tax=Streptomyces sp. NPDC006551 TaxID=3157178 RepID=UPI0033A87229